MEGHSMASCVRNISTESNQHLIIFLQVIIDNVIVGDLF